MHPTDELKRLQGPWKVNGLFWSVGEGGRLPDQLGLNDRGSEVVIEGNRLTLGGQTRATLSNDLSLPAQQKEIGFVGSNLIMLTLPDGKGILCSYRPVEKGCVRKIPRQLTTARLKSQSVVKVTLSVKNLARILRLKSMT